MASHTTLYTPSTIVPAGTNLKDAKLIPLQWERAFAPADAVTSLDSVVGKFAVIELIPDRPILLSQLSDQRIIAPFALGTGFRAVKINVSREGAGEGQIVPGRSVDVVWNYLASDGYRALLIAQNLRVLAVGDNTARFTRSVRRPAGRGEAIILEATFKDALNLVHASRSGTIQLSIRPPDDRANTALPEEGTKTILPAKPTPTPTQATDHALIRDGDEERAYENGKRIELLD